MKMADYMPQSVGIFSELMNDEGKLEYLNIGKGLIIRIIQTYSQILNKTPELNVNGLIHALLDCYRWEVSDIEPLNAVISILSYYKKMNISNFLDKEVDFKFVTIHHKKFTKNRHYPLFIEIQM